jgi:NAD(P) transhydrogenase subunit alpha
MKIGIIKETAHEEHRVAAIPPTVAKLIAAGMQVFIESGAGNTSSILDKAYEDAGATIVASAELLLQNIDIVLKVQRPHASEIDLLKEGTLLIAPIYPMQNAALVMQLNEKNITTFSLDMLPRIARAQSMDILSSMSNIAGYKSVILAANHLGKIFPMMTTAAGTIPPTKVIVIGAGVAGLQAIATARRLGAVVIAFDTRAAAGEQVKSLGAEFVSLEISPTESHDANGYAKEQTDDFYQHEQVIIARYIKEADVIITTALIPGKRAPLLITAAMVKEMRVGSVIVDLSVEQQGNCELSEPGKIIQTHGITIIGILNLPSTVPIHASQLYARNMLAFLNYILPQLKNDTLDLADAIIKSTLISYRGEIIHPLVKQVIQKEGAFHAA